MKVKKLMATLMYKPAGVEIYTENMTLITRMDPDVFLVDYAECKVKKFWLYTFEDELELIETTLEVILK